MKRWVLTVAAVGVLAGVALAGTIYKLVCSNDACGYKSEISLGGGRAFEQACGYCTTCKEFVGVSWKRGGTRHESATTIWDGKTGKTLTLFACPKCKKPFLPVEKIEDLTHCPKCGKNGLKHEEHIMFD